MNLILGIQVLTFLLMGICFVADGQWRLGVAQLMLAVIQAVVYSGEMR